jgi:hypothetical protein
MALYCIGYSFLFSYPRGNERKEGKFKIFQSLISEDLILRLPKDVKENQMKSVSKILSGNFQSTAYTKITTFLWQR